ncbi:MAG: ribosome biogenesis GTPase Der [Tepidisphaeraceae bacterium]|jgi:GTP-binding protein
MPRLAIIAIVGRPNVGKSSLLNGLAHKLISIVQDAPGVTRDRISTPLQIDGRWVELVDTGGFGFVDPDKLTDHIRHQIDLALAQSAAVLFVVDCHAGPTTVDKEIATLLRKRGIKTILLANKADGPSADTALAEFARLGLGTPIGISATNGRNLDLVFTAIAKTVDLKDAPKEIPPPEMLLAIVGKRNAGKSTLVNSIAHLYEDDTDRVIVSQVPGTTRDSIDVRFEKEGKSLIVIDTAGVRKKRQMVSTDIDFYSFHRAQRSIRRCDVVAMLIDATLPVSEPDKKLARYIADQMKPVIIVMNKWDLAMAKARQDRPEADDTTLMEEYGKYLDDLLVNLDFAPVAFVTAKDSKNVQIVLDTAQRLFKEANTRLTTGQLNRVVRKILQEKLPSTPSGRKARIYYATQASVAPPTIVLFVNNPKFLDQTYQRFMVNRLREELPFGEIPIQLIIRGRPGRSLPKSLDEATDKDLEETPQEPEPKPKRKTKPLRGARR